MAAGIAVVAAPALLLGLGGYWVVNKHKEAHRREEQEARLQEAIRKHDALLRELQEETNASADRIGYLQHLVGQLQLLIVALRAELSLTSPA